MNLSNENIEKKVTAVVGGVFIVIIVIIALIFGSILALLLFNLSPVDKKNTNEIIVTIESGSTKKQIAKELKEQNLIKNEYLFLAYSKLSGKNTFMAGIYSLNKGMSMEEILDSVNRGNNLLKDTVTLTFVEGKRFTYYANVIEDGLNIPSSEVIDKCKDKTYLKKLINKYWFLNEDILNNNLYYPLEGYLFPDTYEFYKTATTEDVIEKLLDAMDEKLSVYKTNIEDGNMKIHSLLTLASMVELEAVTASDRSLLAGVFNNRMNANMTLGSDVTTYYAEQKELTQKLSQDELNRCNAYNTRGSCVKGLPVGPICSPSYTSIIASIIPGKTDAYYFVADKKNKIYYAKNIDEHNKNISYLKQNDLWPE